jgi:CAAX prenyl protease-like protein
MVTEREHGWWPYVVPYAAFLGLVELQARLPEAVSPWLLPLKVAVPAALLVWFARRGAFPELRGFRLDVGALLDVAVGIGLAVLWVAPFLIFEGLPRGSEAFDPGKLGPEGRPLVLGLRLLGFGVVTPFVEELFVRSFLLRVADVLWDGRGDFRRVPIGHFRWPSFLITTVWFTLSHAPWEWIVAAPTGVLFTMWLYRRRHIGATILAHAVTNATIWALVVLGPLDLWVFL